MKKYTTTDFVYLIDSKFDECVGKINRIDIKWGAWSREMNLAVRKKMDEEDTDTLILGLVFSYWIVVSQLLDLLYECKGLKAVFRGRQIKAKTEEAIDLRERILMEDASH